MAFSASSVGEMKCWHCGGCFHQGQCPRIKAIEFFADGVVRRVEYHEPPPAEVLVPPLSDEAIRNIQSAMMAQGKLTAAPGV